MPTYDYQCRSCGTVTEVIHSMLEEGPSVCEVCGGELRRMIFPTGIIFKGSGFYRNDSRSGGSSEASEPPSKPASAPAPTPTTTAPKPAKGSSGSDSGGS